MLGGNMLGIVKTLRGGVVSLLQTLLGLVAGLCVYVSAAVLIGDRWLWNMAMALVLSPMFGFAAVLIHEAGHAIAAWRCNWVIRRIVVWPVSYAPQGKTWAWAPGIASRGDMFGWVAAHPKGSGGSRKEETLVLVGGVVANLLSAALCLLLAQAITTNPTTTFLTAFAVFSIVMAIVNALPWKLAGQSTDGLQLWRLWSRLRRRRSAKGSQRNAPRK